MKMRAAILVVVLALAVAACGANEQPAKPVAAPPPPPPRPAAPEPVPGPPIVPPAQEQRACKGDVAGLGGERLAYAAVAERETVAYEEPGGEHISSFGVHNVNGHVTVFGVRRIILGPDQRPDQLDRQRNRPALESIGTRRAKGMPRRAARRPGAGQTALSIETPSLWRKSVIARSLGSEHNCHRSLEESYSNALR